MFYTSSEAEVCVPRVSPPNGEHSWRWVELGLQIPYFLLSIYFSTKDMEIVRRLLLGEFQGVLDIVSRQTDDFRILDLALLSPGYMNGSGSYQLGTVKEVWGVPGAVQPDVFVMSDGSRLSFSVAPHEDEDVNIELLFAL